MAQILDLQGLSTPTVELAVMCSTGSSGCCSSQQPE